MKRATTPNHIFVLPVESDSVQKFLLTYAQNGKIILEKSEKDMTVLGREWSVVLSQDETKLFKSDYANAQVRVLMNDGKALASDVFRIYVGLVLNDEELVSTRESALNLKNRMRCFR